VQFGDVEHLSISALFVFLTPNGRGWLLGTVALRLKLVRYNNNCANTRGDVFARYSYSTGIILLANLPSVGCLYASSAGTRLQIYTSIKQFFCLVPYNVSYGGWCIT